MTAKKILVDDEFQITRVLRQSLTAHRYDVGTAADGVSAARRSVTGTPISFYYGPPDARDGWHRVCRAIEGISAADNRTFRPG